MGHKRVRARWRRRGAAAASGRSATVVAMVAIGASLMVAGRARGVRRQGCGARTRRRSARADADEYAACRLARPLGLALRGGPGDVGMFVEDLVAGGNAEQGGVIKKFDLISRVGSVACAGESFADIARLLAGEEGTDVEIELCRRGPRGLTNHAGRVYLAANAQREGVTVTASGLQYRWVERGDDDGARVADSGGADALCRVHYHGTLVSGVCFDSSYDRGAPIDFKPTQVIKGWGEALLLMREGDIMECALPCELAYGSGGAGDLIDGGEALIFKIELVRVIPP